MTRCSGRAGVPCGERVDERTLAWRRLRLQRLRLAHEFERVRLVVGLHQRVDVRPQHQGLAPVGHRQSRAEAGRLAERPARFGMVEGVPEVQALVHEALGASVRRAHTERVGTQVLQARGEFAARTRLDGLRGLVVVLVSAGRVRRGCLCGGVRGRHQDHEQERGDKARGVHEGTLLLREAGRRHGAGPREATDGLRQTPRIRQNGANDDPR